MSKGLALLEQSLLQYDEEILRARLPPDPRATLQKRDVSYLSPSSEGDSSPEIIKKEDEEIPVELPFNTVIVKNKYDATEKRASAEEHSDGGRSDGGRSDGGRSDGGRSDGERSDGERSDGGRSDGGRSDGGRSDGGRSDGGRSDGGRSDGGRSDGGRSDGGRSDGGRSDGGRSDGGRSDGGRSDGGRSEAEEPGCSSETKGLVFSSFDSDSDEWEPPAPSDGHGEAADVKQMEKGAPPATAKPDSSHVPSGPVWGRSALPIDSFIFHNCPLKENRNTRANEPHRDRTREKEKPGCSSATPVRQNTDNSDSTRPQNAAAAPGLPNTGGATAVQTSPAALKKPNTNSGADAVKTTKHKCAECGKYFQCEAHLQRHMLIHYGLKPFECPVCDKAFRYKSSYKAHLNMHTEEKPLSCSICDKGFTQSRDLRRHMLSHTDEKNFDCQECGGKFKHKHNLIRHISVIHKAEKPYPCPMCDKAFAQKHDFMTHMRTHSGEKPFSCHICTRSFGAKGTLRTHMKVHRKRVPKDLQEALAFDTLEESMADL